MRGQEVTFLIKKSLSGRIGWKIMPEDENINLKNMACIEQVMERIRWGIAILIKRYVFFDYFYFSRDLQFSGETIPSQITIVIE